MQAKKRPPWQTSKRARDRTDDPAAAADADYAEGTIHKRAYGADRAWVVSYVARWRGILIEESDRIRRFEDARAAVVMAIPLGYPHRATVERDVRAWPSPMRTVFEVVTTRRGYTETDHEGMPIAVPSLMSVDHDLVIRREALPRAKKSTPSSPMPDWSWVRMASLLLTVEEIATLMHADDRAATKDQILRRARSLLRRARIARP